MKIIQEFIGGLATIGIKKRKAFYRWMSARGTLYKAKRDPALMASERAAFNQMLAKNILEEVI